MYLYLAGPISGKNQKEMYQNLERFAEKARELRSLGLKIFSPAESEPPNKKWEWYLASDIDTIYKEKFDGIYLMQGWKESPGAKLEREVALNLGLKIIEES